MEGSSGAHRVTQRRLAEPGEPAPAPEPPSPDAPSPPTVVATPPRTPVRSAEPSDVELRRRQSAWRRERARFERSKSDRQPDPVSPD
jgi:hypothetical protein